MPKLLKRSIGFHFPFLLTLICFSCAIEHYDEKRSRKQTLIEKEEIVVNGAISPQFIEKTISRNLGGIKYCYESALLLNENLEGKIVVAFNIKENGSVDMPRVIMSAYENAENLNEQSKTSLEKCVVKKISRLDFKGAGKTEIITVYYPFTFRIAK